MRSDTGNHEIDVFLAAHAPVEFSAAFAPGEVFGDWRVTAFLGRGGSSEVYRVVNTTLGTAAALKVCVRNPERDISRDKAVCARFRREVKLLEGNKHPAFPCFLGSGEREGRPWYVMELLEYRPLPMTEREIARFLLAVASGVQHLHSQGIIHRDIKPGNILWRSTGRTACEDTCPREPVLIDLGLAKDVSAVRGHAGDSLSIVDGKAMGLGTPRYAAPEQMSGETVSSATDVYALGMLANDCFGGNPPRAWKRIIERATSSIPERRYQSVAALARAIRRRHFPKFATAFYFAGVAIVVAFVFFSGNAKHSIEHVLVGSDEFISNYNNWYAKVYGKEHVEKENAARERFGRAASKADEIASLRSDGKPVSAEEYSRLENELTNLVERLEFFRDRWQEMRKRWEKGKKGGIIERQSFKTKPVTIQLLEMHKKRIRDCLDGR